ncbi:MAG: V-type ATP synthase subunit C [Clostridium sp.]|nr:V-type ATP synthase subunit C [Clostridium sp.]
MSRRKKINELDYNYAVARIRAIEKGLLDNSKFDRMVEAKTSDEALKVLLEAGYGHAGTEIKSVFEYEKLLKDENKKVYELLNELVPGEEIINIFLLANDYHNVKAILKAEFSGQNETSILIEPGSIPLNKLKLMIKDRNMKEMPDVMKSAIEECIDTYSRTLDPQMIDLILDKACYRHMQNISGSLDSKFLNELILAFVDLTNIKIFLRVRNLKKTWDFLQKVLVPGGTIDTKVFFENFDAPLESFVQAVKHSRYGSLLEKSMESINRTGNLTEFEKLSDNFITSFVKKARYITFGIEPLIGYLMAKETEIKNARIIMVGKINNISNDIIRERLREAYV